MSPKNLMQNILSDMKVDLSQKFDRNFEDKGFFGKKWKERRNTKGKGSLLHVTGTMRRSIRASVKGNGVVFSSSEPYTTIHNEGGEFAQSVRSHTRRRKGKSHSVKAHSREINMPQRQFIGDHDQVKQAVKKIVDKNLGDYFKNLAKQIR